MNKYTKFQITFISKSEYMENESHKMIEYIKTNLIHTDILEFNYIKSKEIKE